MKHLRFRTIIFSCWLIACFSIERLWDPIDISNLAYVFILSIAVTILFASRIEKIPLWAILTVSITVFLVLKILTRAPIANTAIGITVIEICAILLSVLFTYWVSMAIFDFENAVAKIIIGRSDRMPEQNVVGQAFLYREVERARNHERPLALMAVEVDEKSPNLPLDRVVQEIQHSMVKQYMLSGVSKLLCDQLEDCAVIVQNNDRFLIALPETKPEEVPVIIERLRRQVTEHVGVKLEIGTATLPKDSLTFEGLLERATIEMKASLKSQVLVDVNKTPSDHSMTTGK